MNTPRTVRILSWSLAGATLFMIFAGGMVTSLKAGDSVPDWPLSYGQLLPPMEGLVFFEHGHRMVGWLVGLFCIGLAVLQAPRAWALMGLVLFQGLLGGIRVLVVPRMPLDQTEAWRAGLASIHALTAQGFFVLAWVTARRSTPESLVPPPSPPPSGGRDLLPLVALGAVVIQAVLGILARQANVLVMGHAIWGVVTVGFISVLASRLSSLPLASVALAQAALGLGSLALRMNTEGAPPSFAGALIRSAHVAAGALTLGLTVVARGSGRDS